jgi:hypothetical protein
VPDPSALTAAVRREAAVSAASVQGHQRHVSRVPALRSPRSPVEPGPAVSSMPCRCDPDATQIAGRGAERRIPSPLTFDAVHPSQWYLQAISLSRLIALEADDGPRTRDLWLGKPDDNGFVERFLGAMRPGCDQQFRRFNRSARRISSCDRRNGCVYVPIMASTACPATSARSASSMPAARRWVTHEWRQSCGRMSSSAAIRAGFHTLGGSWTRARSAPSASGTTPRVDPHRDAANHSACPAGRGPCARAA